MSVGEPADRMMTVSESEDQQAWKVDTTHVLLPSNNANPKIKSEEINALTHTNICIFLWSYMIPNMRIGLLYLILLSKMKQNETIQLDSRINNYFQ